MTPQKIVRVDRMNMPTTLNTCINTLCYLKEHQYFNTNTINRIHHES